MTMPGLMEKSTEQTCSVFIVRGPQGIGKDILFKNGAAEIYSAVNNLSGQNERGVAEMSRVSADDYFVTEDGSYRWDRSRLDDAHVHCMRSFMSQIGKVENAIFVLNTFRRLWEVSPYTTVASACWRRSIIINVKRGYGVTHEDMSKRSRAHISAESIAKTESEMERMPGIYRCVSAISHKDHFKIPEFDMHIDM